MHPGAKRGKYRSLLFLLTLAAIGHLVTYDDSYDVNAGQMSPYKDLLMQKDAVLANTIQNGYKSSSLTPKQRHNFHQTDILRSDNISENESQM